MARLDVYAGHGSAKGGSVVDVQASLLDFLDTGVVIPLIPSKGASVLPTKELNPIFEVEGQSHTLLTQAVSAVRKRDLRRKVTSLEAFHDQITRALDILLLGF